MSISKFLHTSAKSFFPQSLDAIEIDSAARSPLRREPQRRNSRQASPMRFVVIIMGV